jgi:hypothetical protein
MHTKPLSPKGGKGEEHSEERMLDFFKIIVNQPIVLF